jgi:hypothetical protein
MRYVSSEKSHGGPYKSASHGDSTSPREKSTLRGSRCPRGHKHQGEGHPITIPGFLFWMYCGADSVSSAFFGKLIPGEDWNL